ncbi:MAG TPA: T9SS type A sorting domain-containing protein [Puia sp.]|jgi:hypothetical protein
MKNPYFLSFLAGLLLSLLIFVHLQDRYENTLFNTLSRQVSQNAPSKEEDSILICAMNTCYEMLKTRSTIFDHTLEKSWISNYFHPLSADLIAADRAGGSYSLVLCRLLQVMNYRARLVQTNSEEDHILVEAHTSKGWVVLDPLNNLYSARPDGNSYHFSHRTWFLRKYQILSWILLSCVLLVSYGMVTRLINNRRVRVFQPAVFTASVFPNPVKGIIKIKLNGVHANEDFRFEVVNPAGMVVYHKDMRSTGTTTVKQLPRPGISGGKYLYRITRKSTSQVTNGVIIFQ